MVPSSLEPPVEFLCPITTEIMRDPLMTRNGLSFERKAILQWISNHNNTCPMTREPLTPSGLVTNAALKGRIQAWLQENGQEAEMSDDGDSIPFTTKQKNLDGVFATFTASSAQTLLRQASHHRRRVKTRESRNCRRQN
uniref:U-box domain-containing protein n=1 Tax=Entomoneis paludosa TaxID=265537 RepID=A0A7S2YQY8_9STRA|mmetsp:Transcript_6489/g.13547  ORF Transcript_6489/g.13547 Transcript_6489/m.13547 type:complete len:139 (+) Transcript_6489:182-598(+)